MNPASAKFHEDGTMTLVYDAGQSKDFATVSEMVNFCNDNRIEVWEFFSAIRPENQMKYVYPRVSRA